MRTTLNWTGATARCGRSGKASRKAGTLTGKTLIKETSDIDWENVGRDNEVGFLPFNHTGRFRINHPAASAPLLYSIAHCMTCSLSMLPRCQLPSVCRRVFQLRLLRLSATHLPLGIAFFFLFLSFFSFFSSFSMASRRSPRESRCASCREVGHLSHQCQQCKRCALYA